MCVEEPGGVGQSMSTNEYGFVKVWSPSPLLSPLVGRRPPPLGRRPPFLGRRPIRKAIDVLVSS
jgi:hypothetical protein